MPTFRSGRRISWQRRVRARPVSEARWRSWNSSKSTQDTFSRAGSAQSMRVSTPSVTTRSLVFALTLVSLRMARPTSSPRLVRQSPARCEASMRAATRLGSRRSTRPSVSSRAQRGTRVLLPVPGGACRRKAGFCRAHAMSLCKLSIGRGGRGGRVEKSGRGMEYLHGL